MGIGIIPFNHSSWYPYFSECPKTRMNDEEVQEQWQLGSPI